jgi:hypothetical protein
LILSIQGRTERESTQQTEDTRTGCSCRDGGGRPNSERERDRWSGWRRTGREWVEEKIVKRERETGRRVGGGDERMDVIREEVGEREKFG